MGAFVSKELPKEKVSHEIDKVLEEDGKKTAKDCEILLLGTSESGECSITKQMRIIQSNGFTPYGCLSFRPVVYSNLLESAQCCIKAMEQLDLDWVNSENRALSQRVLGCHVDINDESFVLDPEIAQTITSLVADPVFPAIMDKSHTFDLMDSAEYFLAHVKRIGEAGYIPNETDILRAQTRTTGITETRLKQGELSIRISHLSGQRSELKKWIHFFENVTSIIFYVSLPGYDEVFSENSEYTRMDESLALFEAVVNSQWFTRTSIILLMGEVDVFKSKLKKSPMGKYFPEYTGGADINKASKYILWRFQQANRRGLMVYPHLTQVTDTSNVRLVFAAIKETLLQNVLRERGIL